MKVGSGSKLAFRDAIDSYPYDAPTEFRVTGSLLEITRLTTHPPFRTPLPN